MVCCHPHQTGCPQAFPYEGEEFKAMGDIADMQLDSMFSDDEDTGLWGFNGIRRFLIDKTQEQAAEEAQEDFDLEPIPKGFEG